MRVEVDERRRICSMQCQLTCPEVFKVEANVSTVRLDPVPPQLESRCREAAEACPSGAITVVEQ
jgi:ferredoxin